ncbi:hypothetical protein JK192_12025 [Gluconobacter cerinus]|uniref:DUF5677 domain-containing protein n=1 Tax=Gluconobacter cerinus TaxID=38307 RepID=UPI001B8BCA86|nr:DUF5677 domain-containing protein [Gluconobacter cerinus]MBS1032106.1 hypothetical protein [Gluconobacter cerinus]
MRASLVKAYEFCKFSYGGLKNEFAFHCVGGLRSICEDLIVLKFISTLPLEDQNTLLFNEMAKTNHNSMRYQADFFGTFRVGQPVLSGGYTPESLVNINSQVDDVWRRHGWPNAKHGKWPPTEQLAQKVGKGTVDVIYNYIFRLTSSTVHFSTRSLLRTGWGTVTPEGLEATFSTKNMSKYYTAFCQVYGIFLFSVYFEFFPDLLRITPKVKSHVQKMRVDLAKLNRWPEMLTYEEMNQDIPKNMNVIYYILRQLQAEKFEEGFILNGEKLN